MNLFNQQNMKALFLVFYGFQEYNGISKKIKYQVNALKKCGLDIRTCYYEVAPDGSRQWLIDNKTLTNLGKGIIAKLKKRISFHPIIRYVEEENISLIYIRSYHNANPFTIHFCERIKEKECENSPGNTNLSLRSRVFFSQREDTIVYRQIILPYILQIYRCHCNFLQ